MIKFELKRQFSIILIYFALSLLAYANKNFNINFNTEFGLLNGYISEYVFDQECLNTEHMLSRLDWDISCIPYFEIEADGDFYKYFHFSTVGRIGLPGNSGFMQDYDWLNSKGGDDGTYSSWKLEDPTQLTNYSKHKNSLDTYYGFSVLLGGNIYIPGTSVIITPFASYEYRFISFEAEDGFRKYKKDDWIRKDYVGKVIAYKQEYNSVLFGVETSANLTTKLLIRGTFSMSPSLCFNNSLDYHILRNSYFLDIINNAMEFKAHVKFIYSLGENNSLGFSTSIQYIPITQGLSYKAYPYENKYYISDKLDVLGGTSSLLWNCCLNFELHF